jgi:DNA-binding NarL/FixJ family response regulator
MQPSIIIADDHPLILKGLKDFLVEKKYNVEASANNGKVALNYIEKLKPDIAILDIQMPFLTGLEIAQKCIDLGYKTKIILITFEKSEKIYNEAKRLNVYGYVLKEFALVEIENCITSVLKNKPYFSPELIEYIQPYTFPREIKSLTPTELKITKLIAQEYTTPQIAESLSVSKRTVDKHRTNISSKLKLAPKPTSLFVWAALHKEHLLKYTY